MDTTAKTDKGLRLFGYPSDNDELEAPLKMAEVTIAADSRTLRNLAAFLLHTADLIETHGDKFGHEHYSDFSRGDCPAGLDIVVART